MVSALRLPAHGFPIRVGLARFVRELLPNGVALGFSNLGSRALFLLKKSPEPCKNWSFAWKIENRPTYGDFEKKILDPQLHQIFKPIRKFFCTFLPIYQFKLRTPLKHIKVPKKYKTKKCITFTHSLTHFTSLHFTSLTSTIDLGESYRGRYRRSKVKRVIVGRQWKSK